MNKIALSHLAFLSLIFLSLSCGQNQGNTSNGDLTTSSNSTNINTATAADTSGHFIKNILNVQPKQVEKILGQPDKPLTTSIDCDYLPTCISTTYQNGKYEALYYDNRLKWLEINRTDLYNENAIEWIGFPKTEPTFAGTCIYWRNVETRGTATGHLLNIKGLRNVSACPEWIIVSVDTYYKGKF